MLLLGVFIFLGLGLFGFLWWDQRAKPLSNEKKIFNMLLAWLQDQHSYKKVTSNDSLTMGQLLDRLQIKYPHLGHSLLALKKEMARQLYYPDAQGINKQDSQRIIKLIKILKKQTS